MFPWFCSMFGAFPHVFPAFSPCFPRENPQNLRQIPSLHRFAAQVQQGHPPQPIAIPQRQQQHRWRGTAGLVAEHHLGDANKNTILLTWMVHVLMVHVELKWSWYIVNIYIYTYVYRYVYICVYIYTYVYRYMYIYICRCKWWRIKIWKHHTTGGILKGLKWAIEMAVELCTLPQKHWRLAAQWL